MEILPTIKQLEIVLADFKATKENCGENYIAIIKNNCSEKEYNRSKTLDFIIITGNDLFDAVEAFNDDISHDNYIDLDFESSVFLEEFI